MAVLRREIERRSREGAADRFTIVRMVLSEMTPPGWRYQLYPPSPHEGPDFILIPAAFAG